MKILVTGAAGFIGSALVLRLLERGDEVTGIDNHNDYYDPALKEARLARCAPHITVITDATPETNYNKDNIGIKIMRVQKNFLGRLRKKILKVTPSNNNSKRKQTVTKIICTINSQSTVRIIKKLQWPDYAWTWIQNDRKVTLEYLDNTGLPDVFITVSHLIYVWLSWYRFQSILTRPRLAFTVARESLTHRGPDGRRRVVVGRWQGRVDVSYN